MPSGRASHHVFPAGVTRKPVRFPRRLEMRNRRALGDRRKLTGFRRYIKPGSPNLEGLLSQIGNDILCHRRSSSFMSTRYGEVFLLLADLTGK